MAAMTMTGDRRGRIGHGAECSLCIVISSIIRVSCMVPRLPAVMVDSAPDLLAGGERDSASPRLACNAVSETRANHF